MGLHREREFLLFGLGAEVRSWRGVWLLLGVFLGAMVFAAIFSPPVYWAMTAWAQAYPNDLNTYLAAKDFPRYFDRLRWLPVIIVFPWLLKVCGLWSWRALGMRGGPGWWRSMLSWFGAGIVMLGLVAATQAFGIGIGPKGAWSSLEVFHVVAVAVLAGMILALLEESVFRGLVLRIFYTAMRPLPAVFIASIFFAIVHFKKIPAEIWSDETVVTWGSGFYVGFWTLLSVGTTFEWIKFLNFFLTGLVLCLLFLKTRSLWPCIGLHAGWVAFRQIYGNFYSAGNGEFNWLWGSERMIDGLLPALFLIPLIARLISTMPHDTRFPQSAAD